MIDGSFLRYTALFLLVVSLAATLYLIFQFGLKSIPAMSPQLILLTIATALTAQCCSGSSVVN